MLRILVDANIRYAEEAFGLFGYVHVLPGHAITHDALVDTDVLLVRSVTRVDAALVSGTPVRFVGTATAGTDHLDLDGLAALGIATASAPGSNATSVAEYVLTALLALAAARGEALSGRTLGVVGAGAVGGRLVPRARALGMAVVVCDPPREAAGCRDHAYQPLADVLAVSDVVTLHVPLTATGLAPTRAMIGAEALRAMRPGAWLVNTARGGVVDGPALQATDRLGALVLDCWPGEPSPPDALIARADLATPHIAGYSADGKVAGTAMLVAALGAWAEEQASRAEALWTPPEAPPLVVDAPPVAITGTPEGDARWLDALARQAYAIRDDDARFRAAMATASTPGERASAFARLRRTYPVRREGAFHTVRGAVPAHLVRAVTVGLEMRQAPG